MAGIPQTSAVMFADLAGSTALYDKLGDVTAKAAVLAAFQHMSAIITANRGRVIKTIGDEVLCSYTCADDAAAGGIALQSATELRLSGKSTGLRIGFHLGEVIADNNDIFGDVVNIAARLTGAARAGQILTTETAVARLSSAYRQRTRKFDVVQFKGKTQSMRVFELVWEEAANVTRMGGVTQQPGTGDDPTLYTHVDLELGPRKLSLDEDQVPFTLGRDAANGLMVPASLASRVHVKLEYQRGKFVLSDHSTNGTYVAIGSAPEVFLRRESMPLMDQGTISLGCPAQKEPAMVVKFRTY